MLQIEIHPQAFIFGSSSASNVLSSEALLSSEIQRVGLLAHSAERLRCDCQKASALLLLIPLPKRLCLLQTKHSKIISTQGMLFECRKTAYLHVELLVSAELPFIQGEVMERSAPGVFGRLTRGTLFSDRWAQTYAEFTQGFFNKSTNIQSFFWPADSGVSASSILCLCCGLRAFRELAYKYRQNIPASELPGPNALPTSRQLRHPDAFVFTAFW